MRKPGLTFPVRGPVLYFLILFTISQFVPLSSEPPTHAPDLSELFDANEPASSRARKMRDFCVEALRSPPFLFVLSFGRWWVERVFDDAVGSTHALVRCGQLLGRSNEGENAADPFIFECGPTSSARHIKWNSALFNVLSLLPLPSWPEHSRSRPLAIHSRPVSPMDCLASTGNPVVCLLATSRCLVHAGSRARRPLALTLTRSPTDQRKWTQFLVYLAMSKSRVFSRV